MNYATKLLQLMAAAAILTLSGCGGGGSSSTSTGSYQVSINTAPTLNITSGGNSQIAAVVISTPNPIASAAWTAVANKGGPALTLTNNACATAVKKSQTNAAPNSVTAEWDCSVGIAAPAGLTTPTTYTVTITATDSVGNASASNTVVTVSPSTTPVLTVTAPATLSIAAGNTVQVPGVITSFPNAVATAAWTAVTTNGSSALPVSNGACSVTTKSTNSGTNTWNCVAGLTAPPGITSAQDYTLTLTATDTVGTVMTSTSTVTLTPASGVTATPVAVASVPATATSGATLAASCVGSQGYAATPGIYSYQWTATPALSFTTPSAGMTSFVAPSVTTATPYQLTCTVTDSNQNSASTTSTVTISPSTVSTIVPSVVQGTDTSPNAVVSLNGSGSTWVNASGTTIPGTIYYNWTQSSGPTVTILNANSANASAIMPSTATATSSVGFTLTLSNQPFVNGITSGTITASAQVVYFLSQNPPLTLSTTFSTAPTAGSYVIVPVIATGTPVTTLPLYYSWTQIAGPSVILGGANTSTLDFAAPSSAATLEFQVNVGYAPVTVTNPGDASMNIVVDVTPATTSAPAAQ